MVSGPCSVLRVEPSCLVPLRLCLPPRPLTRGTCPHLAGPVTCPLSDADGTWAAFPSAVTAAVVQGVAALQPPWPCVRAAAGKPRWEQLPRR